MSKVVGIKRGKQVDIPRSEPMTMAKVMEDWKQMPLDGEVLIRKYGINEELVENGNESFKVILMYIKAMLMLFDDKKFIKGAKKDIEAGKLLYKWFRCVIGEYIAKIIGYAGISDIEYIDAVEVLTALRVGYEEKYEEIYGEAVEEIEMDEEETAIRREGYSEEVYYRLKKYRAVIVARNAEKILQHFLGDLTERDTYLNVQLVLINAGRLHKKQYIEKLLRAGVKDLSKAIEGGYVEAYQKMWELSKKNGITDRKEFNQEYKKIIANKPAVSQIAKEDIMSNLSSLLNMIEGDTEIIGDMLEEMIEVEDNKAKAVIFDILERQGTLLEEKR